MRVEGVKQLVPYYTLDVIISVGYRVKSKRGVEFRRWANSVLKQYILQGYAVNDKLRKFYNITTTLDLEWDLKSRECCIKVGSFDFYTTSIFKFKKGQQPL